MSTIAIQRPNFSRRWRFGTGGGYRKLHRASSCWAIVSCARKGKEFLGEPKIKNFSPSNILFDGLQVGVERDEAKFGQFVVREARFYREYWTAAWLRAESHWEDRENERYAVNNIREFAQQEYNAMTRRYNATLGENCRCIVMVQKSVVGTLDLSIQHFKHGETFPGDCLKHPLLCLIDRKASICYAYIANLCVAKSARRQGVANCMLEYAISTAKANGAQKVFVHVHRHNKPARDLYEKIGFQVVDAANFQLSVEQTYLLCLEVSSYYGRSFSI